MASPSGDDGPAQSSVEPPAGATTPARPTLVGDSGDVVAFLDAPGLHAPELLEAVDRILARMSDGAILTVFTDDPTAPQIAGWSAGHRVELLAVIPHSDRDGSTLTFRRAEPGSGSAAAGAPQL